MLERLAVELSLVEGSPPTANPRGSACGRSSAQVNKAIALLRLCAKLGVRCGPTCLTPAGALGRRHAALRRQAGGGGAAGDSSPTVEVEVVPLYSW